MASAVTCILDLVRVFSKTPTIYNRFKRVVLKRRGDRPAGGLSPIAGPANNFLFVADLLKCSVGPWLDLRPANALHIPLIGQEARWIRRRVDDLLRDRLVGDLASWCTEANEGKTGFRKDLVGLPPHVDHDLVRALRHRTIFAEAREGTLIPL